MQVEALIKTFSQENVSIRLFVPHSMGKGISLLLSKITVEDYDAMNAKVKTFFNRAHYRTPSEWLKNPPKEVEHRALTISLLPSNIDRLEEQPFEQTIQELERLDEEYFSMIPSFNQLLLKYCDDADTRLYSKKDLYFLYRQRYIRENGLQVVEVTDERFSGSIRY